MTSHRRAGAQRAQPQWRRRLQGCKGQPRRHPPRPCAAMSSPSWRLRRLARLPWHSVRDGADHLGRA
eukprot:3630965-Pyramimonas_sp.AAC.1